MHTVIFHFIYVETKSFNTYYIYLVAFATLFLHPLLETSFLAHC